MEDHGNTNNQNRLISSSDHKVHQGKENKLWIDFNSYTQGLLFRERISYNARYKILAKTTESVKGPSIWILNSTLFDIFIDIYKPQYIKFHILDPRGFWEIWETGKNNLTPFSDYLHFCAPPIHDPQSSVGCPIHDPNHSIFSQIFINPSALSSIP